MKFDVLTLFPEMFEPLKQSIIKRAVEKNLIDINLINIRDFSEDKHNKVDDTPYGGGAGMILRCEPIFECLDSIGTEDAYIILLSPEGTKYKQDVAKRLNNYKHLIIICGHYEGFDERIKTRVDEVISIGDYILTGGEIPAMAITDSVARLLPGVITKESLDDESFNDNLLDYPTYTKPRDFRGMKVPDVLTSGNHKEIEKYRLEQQIKRTKERRPDLLKEVIKDAS